MPINTRRNALLTLVPLLAGVALRLWLHDTHGLEGDDAFSLALSRIATPQLIDGLLRLELDVHPPLHFLLLKGWALTGESLLALRTLNILIDALTGAFLIAVSRRGARTDGLVIAALWAFSPLLLFGGWLVRMYTLLGLLAAGALWAVVMAATSRRLWRWVAVAAVFSLAALYTHVLGAVVLGAATVGMGLIAARRDNDTATFVILVFAGVFVLWTPALSPISTLYLSGADLGAAVNPANAIRRGAVPFEIVAAALAFRVPIPTVAVTVFAVLVALVTALVPPRPKRPVWAFIVVMLAGIVIFGAGAGLYKPRYVIPFAPVVMLPVAWGASKLLERIPGLGVVVVAALVGVGIWGTTETLARDWRDDWTAAATFIEANAQPEDVIAVVPDWGQEAARYHIDALPDERVRGFFPQIGTGLDLDAAFSPFIDTGGRSWLVRYQPGVSDPDDLALAYFDGRCPPVTRVYPAGMEVSLYDCHRTRVSQPDDVRVQFGEAVLLRGTTVGADVVDARDSRLYDGGGRVLVMVTWEALADGLNSATPQVRLTAPGGAVFGGALADAAAIPIDNVETGDVFEMYYDLNINPDTPPGVYNVEVTVTGPDGARLAASGPGAGEAWFIAGQVTVR